MHSENTAVGQRTFQPPHEYCHLCLQPGPARPHKANPANGSCLSVVSGVTQLRPDLPPPFPQELEIADDGSERTASRGRHTSPLRQVYAEDIHHPCYSWGDVRAARWDWPLEPPYGPCARVQEIRRDCGCVQRWYYPELPHTFNGSHVLPHLKVRGQRYYREALYVSEEHYRNRASKTCERDAHLQEPQWDKPVYNELSERRRVSFQHHEEQHRFISPETCRQSSSSKAHCNGPNSAQTAFFPTEVPQSKLGRSRPPELTPQINGPGQETRTSHGVGGLEDHGNKRPSQGTVREQIKQVVTELEEVLGGLKQVQLEMKEVVQQIDILTSNIDLGEKDPVLTNGGSQDGRQQSVTHSSNGHLDRTDTTIETSHSSVTYIPVNVDSVHINAPPAMRNHASPSSSDRRSVTGDKGSRAVKKSSESTKSTANGTCLPHRTPGVRANKPQIQKEEVKNHGPPVSQVCINPNKTHRPPPYPQNGQLKMFDLCSEHPLRKPPHPGKHKTLSSTVV